LATYKEKANLERLGHPHLMETIKGFWDRGKEVRPRGGGKPGTTKTKRKNTKKKQENLAGGLKEVVNTQCSQS